MGWRRCESPGAWIVETDYYISSGVPYLGLFVVDGSNSSRIVVSCIQRYEPSGLMRRGRIKKGCTYSSRFASKRRSKEAQRGQARTTYPHPHALRGIRFESKTDRRLAVPDSSV